MEIFNVSTSVKVSLDDETQRLLEKEGQRIGKDTVSLIEDIVQRHLRYQEFLRLREKAIPIAKKAGIHSEEDVFKIIS